MVLAMPPPIPTSPPSTHELVVNYKSTRNLCQSVPIVKLPIAPNLRYDVFIDAVKNKKVDGVCMADHQKSAEIFMKEDNSIRTIYFPDGYDIISFVLENDVPLEIHESHIKPSIIDIIGVLIQVAIIRLISNFLNKDKKSAEEVIYNIFTMMTGFNMELQNFMHMTYSIGRILSTDEIRRLSREINCNIYLKRKKIGKLIVKQPQSQQQCDSK
jgi:hypothetical protein